MKNSRVIHIRVTQFEFETLRAMSKKRHCTHSSILRTALGLYFESLKLTPPPELGKTPSGEDLLRSLR
jgi:hypothetical protein